jgi:hypothetical protein
MSGSLNRRTLISIHRLNVESVTIGTSGLMSGIAYLGPPNDHGTSLELVFRRAGIPLLQIRDSLSWPHASHPETDFGWTARVSRLRAQIFGTDDEQYLEYALRLIDEAGITCVLAFWGTRPLPDIRALKRRRPHLRFALTVLCHPLGLSRGKVFLQNLMFNHTVRDLDGLVVSSTVLDRYLKEKLPNSRGIPTLVHSPCWADEYSRHVPLEAAAERPNVIFIGRMDWRAGQSTDNVTGLLRDLMRNGIDVHFSNTPESKIQDEHACPFDALGMKELADFAARFDASLILYDLASAQTTDRFEVTIPDRLITSVAAGIPIALPSETYAACREYLKAYGAVLEFRSMEHLAEQLRDRKRINELRRLAWERSRLYRAEQHLPALLTFLRQLLPPANGITEVQGSDDPSIKHNAPQAG